MQGHISVAEGSTVQGLISVPEGITVHNSESDFCCREQRSGGVFVVVVVVFTLFLGTAG